MLHGTHPAVSNATTVSRLFLYAAIFGLVAVPFVATEPAKHFPQESFVPVVYVAAAVENIPQKSVPVPKAIQKIPEAHLEIPEIGVDAVIKATGLTPDGNMAVPGNNIDVGWFSLGTRPGATGSAVMGGHNEWGGEAGAFADLNQLKKGDVLSVVDASGVSISFVVSDIRTYDATDTTTGIFSSESGAHLNLITCSGSWNPSTKSYTERLVVFADMVPPALAS